MRVDIRHHERTDGWLSKKTYHVVDLTIHFTEEEKAIVRQRKLENDVILERRVPVDKNPATFKGMEHVFDLRIGKFARGETDSYAFATPLEAKQYDAELREVLPRVKEYILQNAEVENKSDSFEL